MNPRAVAAKGLALSGKGPASAPDSGLLSPWWYGWQGHFQFGPIRNFILAVRATFVPYRRHGDYEKCSRSVCSTGTFCRAARFRYTVTPERDDHTVWMICPQPQKTTGKLKAVLPETVQHIRGAAMLFPHPSASLEQIQFRLRIGEVVEHVRTELRKRLFRRGKFSRHCP